MSSPESFPASARQAATGHTFTLVNIAHIPALVDAIVAELCKQYPTAGTEEITRLLPDMPEPKAPRPHWARRRDRKL